MASPKGREREVAFYMVSVNDIEAYGDTVQAEAILRSLTAEEIWQMNGQAANRAALRPGDRLVFYMAGAKRQYIAGTATVASVPEPIPPGIRIAVDGMELPFMDIQFSIADVDLWDKREPIRPLLEKLSFVEKRLLPYWGLYFRQATRKVRKRDFGILTRKPR